MELMERRRIFLNTPHINIVTGFQFVTDMVAPIESLAINFSPIQDLHGYDNPWPAGGGKNLCDPSTIIVGFWDGTGTYSADANYKTSALIPVEPNTNYTGTFFKADKTEVNKLVYTEWDSSENFIKQSTSFDRFVTTANTAYVRVRNYNAQSSLITSNNFLYQFEKGSATAYAPYSNICPISGHTDADVTRTGKNLFDISAYDDASDWTGTPYKYIAIPLPNGQYTISWDKSKGGGFYWLVQVNGAVKGTSNAGPGGSWLWHDTNTSLQKETFTFTVTEGYVYLSCSFGGYFVQKFLPALETVQIEKGETATDYEPYQGDTYSIAFPSEAGTVYGGTLDVVNGVLTVDRAMVDLGTLTWNRTTAYSAPVLYTVVAGKLKSNISMLCSVYKFSGNFGSAGGFANGSGNASIGSCYANEQIFVRDDSYTDTAAFKSAMSGVQLVYELATPRTYQLTPQQILALKGINNLSMSGQVKFWTHRDIQ